MKQLSTIQKRENLNLVYRNGDEGPGSAYHNYTVVPQHDPTNATLLEVKFQCGPRHDHKSVQGVLDSDLLEIVRDRLKCFQAGQYAVRENEMALEHIESALMWMNRRVEDRIEREVLGTTKI